MLNRVPLRGHRHGRESFGFAALWGFAAGSLRSVWTEYSSSVPPALVVFDLAVSDHATAFADPAHSVIEALEVVAGRGSQASVDWKAQITLAPPPFSESLHWSTAVVSVLSRPLHARCIPFLRACSDAAARTYFARTYTSGDDAPRQILADIGGRVPRDFA